MLATTSTGFFSSVAVTIDGSDNAVAAWSTSREEGLISVADLRASGPVLAKVAIPTRARARASVRFSAEPAPWPAPLAGRPRWTFGDGGSAAGERVTHTYRRPGSYTVSVTQADASGAASSASAKIRVARVRAD
jgi:PKD repeat protein